MARLPRILQNQTSKTSSTSAKPRQPLSPEQIQAYSDQMAKSRAETQSWLDRNNSGLWPAGTLAKLLTAQPSTSSLSPGEPPQAPPQGLPGAENPEADQAKAVDVKGKPRRRAVARGKKGSQPK